MLEFGLGSLGFLEKSGTDQPLKFFCFCFFRFRNLKLITVISRANRELMCFAETGQISRMEITIVF